MMKIACLLGLLLLPGCVSQSNLDQRLEWGEQARIQRDMLETQRGMLWEQQQRRGRR
jgi:hypothetical protein